MPEHGGYALQIAWPVGIGGCAASKDEDRGGTVAGFASNGLAILSLGLRGHRAGVNKGNVRGFTAGRYLSNARSTRSCCDSN